VRVIWVGPRFGLVKVPGQPAVDVAALRLVEPVDQQRWLVRGHDRASGYQGSAVVGGQAGVGAPRGGDGQFGEVRAGMRR
jgi:hypothetical protein